MYTLLWWHTYQIDIQFNERLTCELASTYVAIFSMRDILIIVWHLFVLFYLYLKARAWVYLKKINYIPHMCCAYASMFCTYTINRAEAIYRMFLFFFCVSHEIPVSERNNKMRDIINM